MEEVAGRAGFTIQEMAEVTQEAQKQAISINQTANHVKELGEVIRMATNQQKSASDHVLQALSGLATVTQQNVENSQNVSSTVLTLEEVSQRLKLSLAA
jgi:methyl-accepting chemotaxis protein